MDSLKPQDRKPQSKAQTAIEYLLLTTLIVVIFFLNFGRWLPFVKNDANEYFNEVAEGIAGRPVGADNSGSGSSSTGGPGGPGGPGGSGSGGPAGTIFNPNPGHEPTEPGGGGFDTNSSTKPTVQDFYSW